MKLLKIPGCNEGFGVAAEEIIRIQAVSNYSRIYFSNGKVVVVAKVLHWFEDSLPIDMFARVHRSHLVNRMFVGSVNGKRTEKLVLLNGEIITVSRRKKSLFN